MNIFKVFWKTEREIERLKKALAEKEDVLVRADKNMYACKAEMKNSL